MSTSTKNIIPGFENTLWKARNDAKKSQEFMAEQMGVSKRTIQNWEKGVSLPNLSQCIEWFYILGLNPMHYFFEYLYPNFDKYISDKTNEEIAEQVLIDFIKTTTLKEKQELLYIFAGNHGSSWASVLDLFTAHLHTTMQSRFSAASLIIGNYEIEKENNKLVCENDVMPDIESLKIATTKGMNAALNNQLGYYSKDNLEQQ